MIRRFRRFMKGRRGQGMTEYIIIVALIAIAAIGNYALFGKQIRSVVSSIGGQLSGDTASETETIEMSDQAEKDATLGDFGNE